MLAVLYDIHANLPALDAVLADARGAGADRWLLGGDYAALGAWPEETVARLRELGGDATWIAGNHERWLSGDRHDVPPNPVLHAALDAETATLSEEATRFITALAPSAVPGDTFFCHGSPVSDMASFGPEPAGEDATLLAPADGAARVVFGHTHVQFRRPGPGGVELVNPGSVGLPFDGDRRAAYALVGDDGVLDLRRVDYDLDVVIAALRGREEAWADQTAVQIERARL